MSDHGSPFPALRILALALFLAAALTGGNALAAEDGGAEDWRNLYLDAMPVLDLR